LERQLGHQEARQKRETPLAFRVPKKVFIEEMKDLPIYTADYQTQIENFKNYLLVLGHSISTQSVLPSCVREFYARNGKTGNDCINQYTTKPDTKPL
jgi:hypothetical protein